MNLTWHIFKKDFVRLRLAFGLWVVMLGVEILLNWRLFSSAEMEEHRYGIMEMYAGLFSVFLRVAVYILIASLVLDDPLLGTKKMFWVTRPISGGRLLRAKLIGIVLLFGVVPFIVKLPWWLYCGCGWESIGLMAGIEIATLILFAVPAVALASLSGESSRFLLYSLLLLAAIAAVVGSQVVWKPLEVDKDLVGVRLIVVFAVSMVTAVLVSVWLYLTRRFRVAAVFMGGAAGVVALCLYCWPWSFEQLRVANEKQLIGTEKISVEIVKAKVVLAGKGSPIRKAFVRLELRTKNVPEVAYYGKADVEFRWPDGTVVRPKQVNFFPYHQSTDRARSLLKLSAPASDEETDAKNREMAKLPLTPLEVKYGKRQSLVGSTADTEFVMVAEVPITAAQVKRLREEAPACSVAARIELRRPEVILEMPLQEGAEVVGEGMRLRFLAADEDQGNRVEPDGRRMHGRMVSIVSASSLSNDSDLFLVNRPLGVVGRFSGSRMQKPLPLLSNISRRKGYAAVPQLWRTDHWIDAPGALENWTLVAVTYHRLGGFNRTMHTDRLKVEVITQP